MKRFISISQVALWPYIKDVNTKRMKTIVLNTLEIAMNRYLQSDAQSAHRLQKMAGKSISIELSPLNLRFNCRFTPEHASLDMDEGEVAQTTIKGSPLQLLGALVDKNNRHQFF